MMHDLRGTSESRVSLSQSFVLFLLLLEVYQMCAKRQYLFVIHLFVIDIFPSKIAQHEFLQEFQQLQNSPSHKHRWTFRALDS